MASNLKSFELRVPLPGYGYNDAAFVWCSVLKRHRTLHRDVKLRRRGVDRPVREKSRVDRPLVTWATLSGVTYASNEETADVLGRVVKTLVEERPHLRGVKYKLTFSSAGSVSYSRAA